MNATLPAQLYTAQQSRDVDRCAIDVHGIPGPVLMGRAARAAFELLLGMDGSPELVQIFCGVGNNGGDGLLLAMLLHGRQAPVRIFMVAGEPRSPDAQAAAERARSVGLLLEPLDVETLESRGLVVDAMLGTGISGAPREEYARAITAVNQLQRPVLALDVPSGVDSDTGHVAGPAIRADWTISFITAKRGLFTARGEVLAGQRYLDDLQVPAGAFEAVDDACPTLDLDSLKGCLPPRDAEAHKGRFGRCLLVGGDRGMGGAIILAAEAALRSGVGLAKVATRAEHLAPLLARRPECMASVVDHRNDLEDLLPWADAVVLGPGLGQGPWAEQMLQAVLESDKPLILDADALNLLAAGSVSALPAGTIVTPHPGEAARLLGSTTGAVQADRFGAAEEIARRYGTTVVLKGNGSIVSDGSVPSLCAAGNPGMASGGMGDVLSGILGALLAQGLAPGDAARLGTVLHATAADRALAWQSPAGLLASDLFDHVGELMG